MIRGLFLSMLWCGALGAQPGAKTQFVGGTPPGIDPKATARLDLTGADEMVFRSKSGEVRVAYQKVNTLEYGQNVSRRYAAALLVSPILLLSKTRKHYITLGYVDAAGKQQVLVFRVEKADIRTVLAGLQARTGRRVEYQDDDARKAGG
ncbi:MAG: hypothetical protein ABSH40_15030 [Bryobacteraceae bacterium]|jgi:hypothetical protein